MADASDEIKPYKIKVSSKYLDLTKQKLELTRLPHEGSTPKSDDWWEPKPQVEPVIDFWLEKYSWRKQEDELNRTLPQFRTALTMPSSQTPLSLRLHFIHVRSPHASAVPLLLLPPFPFTNLSLGHLIRPLTEPDNATSNQAFHLVIPSLPGVGFSDPLPNNTPAMATVAGMLDALMQRLTYPHYLASNTGAGCASPAEIDWRLIDELARRHPASCRGTHLISPPLAKPRVADTPWEWTKWMVARFFHAGILGYSGEDFAALERTTTLSSSKQTVVSQVNPTQLGLNKLRLRDPNTLAYALCDSPVGLLVFVLKGLRMVGPRATFSQEQIVTLTNLAWLPGPEYAMRFWAHCAAREHDVGSEKAKGEKPRAAITVFLGGKTKEPGQTGGSRARASQSNTNEQTNSSSDEDQEEQQYVPPAWGRSRYEVVHTQRVAGKPGLLAWERPEVIAAGLRGLAMEIIKLDGQIKAPETSAWSGPAIAPLQSVVVGDEVGVKVDSRPAAKLPELPKKPEPSSSRTTGPVPAKLDVVEEEPSRDKGKWKELEPPPPIKDPFFPSDGESPDTLVNTPPLDAK